MNPERWQKINDLFHAAIKREAAEVNSFLEKACDGDEILQKEVVRLISAHQRADGFIQQPAFADAVQIIVEESEQTVLGQQFGAYKIVREIGRGGMGTVYLAERADAEYEKYVAVKLIKRGMDTDAVLHRFRHERQILASLEHPNIARLLDGGTTADGLPYFVMEYIGGEPINEFADANRLSITERLKLFRQVCAAVSYAHQRLVVHRDIKPSNILVTAEGVPKLLDFGIAKLIRTDGEETMQTATGLRLMTPDYASPEQIQGSQVTTMSDVYSLGVVLYELLSGHAPYRFTVHSPEAIAEEINTVEPEKPSTVIFRQEETVVEERQKKTVTENVGTTREGSLEKLRNRLCGDLDNIVLRAMRKEPNRRYASVGQFSEDIRRHLVGLPVIARPDTFRYRAAKFVQRHKVTAAGAVIVFLTLVGGIVTTTWQANQARRQEEIAKTEKERAERRFNDVRKLARSVLFDYHDAIKNLPGSTAIRARLVQDALEYLNGLAAEAGDDFSLQRELATAYERVGDVQGGTLSANLGDTAGAIESYRKSLEIREDLIKSDPHGFEERRDTATSYAKLGNLLWETGDTTGGLENNRRALALLQTLTTENPGRLDLRIQLHSLHDNIGMISQEQGDYAGAIENFLKGLKILESFPAEEKQSEKIRRTFSVTYEHIGMTQLLNGDFEKALENNRRALTIRAKLFADFPDNADYRRTVSVSYYNDGEILAKLEKFREALESYRKDLQIAKELSAQDPDNEQYRGDVAYALIRVGDMLAKIGDNEAALVNYRKSLEIRGNDVKADPSNLWKRSSLIEAHAKICKTLARSGNVSAALAAAAETLALMNKTAVEPTNAAIRSFFGDTYSDVGEAYAALALRQKSIAEGRRKYWNSAREMYERSLQIWQDMQSRGILSNIDINKPEIIVRKIAECNAAALNG